ncbi:hypothetical protein GCM10007049_15620 [Echinicola pacifica]|uniref:HEPN AbiU2-like domain-containing protein n=1 Tax=Echinicola pacifica TaxID=346377 RepID=A0A918PVR1_9BACT|nr:hypothetical protein [Echinicola pacifica]GGZ23519.1 hypothetical protein GCM10007049_15620 [Echinicola pacifica]
MGEKIENFEYVQMSCKLFCTSLNELKLINKERPHEERELVSKPPFKFYRVSLMYMIVMELSKLMERDTKFKKGQKNNFLIEKNGWEGREKTNIASLEKLSRKVNDHLGSSFDLKHAQNMELIDEIRSTDFFKMIRKDRDQKFGHSDSINHDPLSIKSYDLDEINGGLQIKEAIKKILLNCTKAFGDYEFLFDHEDQRTNYFIEIHTRNKETLSRKVCK